MYEVERTLTLLYHFASLLFLISFNSISNFIGDNHFSLLGNIYLVILLILMSVMTAGNHWGEEAGGART